MNLNVHFHMLFMDGVFSKNQLGKTEFKRTNATGTGLLSQLSHRDRATTGTQGVHVADPAVLGRYSNYRVEVTPAKRGKGSRNHEDKDKSPVQQHRSMTWAQRLKRVFNIDVSVCPKCGGAVKVIPVLRVKR